MDELINTEEVAGMNQNTQAALGNLSRIIETLLKVAKYQNMSGSSAAKMIKEFLASYNIYVPEEFVYEKQEEDYKQNLEIFNNRYTPILEAVKKLLELKGEYHDSATNLYNDLNEILKSGLVANMSKLYVTGAQPLSRILNQMKLLLLQNNICIIKTHRSNAQYYSIEYINKEVNHDRSRHMALEG